MKELERQEHPAQRRIDVLITVLLILVVLLCLFVTVQVVSQGYVNVAGYSLFRVVTGSMEPTIPVGALLVSQQVDMQWKWGISSVFGPRKPPFSAE